MSNRHRRRGSGRRSFILIAVLLVVGSALLIVTTLVFVAQAEAAGAASVRERTQSRLLLWSGIQVVSGRLDEQRRRILDGERPELDAEYVIYESGRRQGVVRLLPVTPSGALLAPEAARIDLNFATASALAATGLVDDVLAERITAYRDETLNGSFQSVAELLHVPGVTGEILYGPLDELTVMDDAGGLEPELTDRLADRLADDAPRGLADIVTVYGVEPALQRSGDLRINVKVPWSDELGRRVERRFGEGASQVLKQVMDRGTTFESDAVIFQVMRSFGTAPEEWPDIIDALTTDADSYHFGRLDINAAPYETLVTLEGLDPEQANQIVRTRDSLSADERATIAWPAIEGIVEPEAYDQLAGRITTRSWTYRLRLVAGERDVDADEPGADGGGALANPVIYEVVVDLSDPEPRLAYVRDVRLLQIGAALIAARSETLDEAEAPVVDDDDEGDADRDAAPDPTPGAGRAAPSGAAADRSRPVEPPVAPPVARGGPGDPAGPVPAAPEDGAPASSGPTLEDERAPRGADARRERVGRWRAGR